MLQSYIILIIIPPIEFVAIWLVRWVLKAYDQGRCCRTKSLPSKSSKKTISAYKELYQGPHFDIEYQYAQIWTILLVAFTFGPLMPIFFIYAFLGLFILDVTLRCRIAYSVRRFPIYDQKMNKAMLFGMRYLPLIYYINSSWFYSNQQLFKNYVYANDSHSELFAPSGHDFDDLFT